MLQAIGSGIVGAGHVGMRDACHWGHESAPSELVGFDPHSSPCQLRPEGRKREALFPSDGAYRGGQLHYTHSQIAWEIVSVKLHVHLHSHIAHGFVPAASVSRVPPCPASLKLHLHSGSSFELMLYCYTYTLILSGTAKSNPGGLKGSDPVLRATARLSQRYPPIALYGVSGVSPTRS